MILLIGGAYQGKLDYAASRWGVADSGIYQCSDTAAEVNFAFPVLYGYHLLVLAQIRAGVDPLAFINEHERDLEDKIIIADDISSGIVPVDPESRLWREQSGRAAAMLAARAVEVIRVFCGIGTRLK
ncbi:MAG: bifunctional adenosylcobinamide kinase/adenosylcobinamide-phosphate guanylyltransferase [Clostridiales bacterium]|nr:bifunctional adenosylcobinamide kinase/adenosylcobinamide-phosphate guanylyltransferase [Clostridiales bacterium]